jgi:hypothetical protein
VLVYIILYILYYYYILHILYYTIIICYTYLILYYTLPSSVLFSSSLLSFIYIPPSHFSSLLPPLLLFYSTPHSFYTCRYLHILIYILLFSLSPSSSSPFLPNHRILLIHSILVGTYIYLFIFSSDLSRCFDPACFIGVDG